MTRCVPQENGYPAGQRSLGHLMNPLLIKFVLSRWPDFCLFLFLFSSYVPQLHLSP